MKTIHGKLEKLALIPIILGIVIWLAMVIILIIEY